MNIQQIIDSYPFSDNSNHAAAELYLILDKMGIYVKPIDFGFQERKRGVVMTSLEKKQGITPQEFQEFMGYSHKDHDWYYHDGMRCGITVVDNILYRVIDFGGFNKRPAMDRVTCISKRSDEIIYMPINPNSYSLREIRDSATQKLQKLMA